MIKKELRHRISTRKKSMTLDEREKKSDRIFERLENLAEWKEAQCIFSYVSYNQEVNTGDRMMQWIVQGKKIAVPCVVENEIKFYYIHSISDLKEGYKGILEPEKKYCADGDEGLMLMPGLAFDKRFHRLGYGGGFYDRYLKKYPSRFLKVALAYDFQIFDEIPWEEHDQKVDLIVTENTVIGK